MNAPASTASHRDIGDGWSRRCAGPARAPNKTHGSKGCHCNTHGTLYDIDSEVYRGMGCTGGVQHPDGVSKHLQYTWRMDAHVSKETLVVMVSPPSATQHSAPPPVPHPLPPTHERQQHGGKVLGRRRGRNRRNRHKLGESPSSVMSWYHSRYAPFAGTCTRARCPGRHPGPAVLSELWVVEV